MEQAIGVVLELIKGMAKIKIDRKGMCGDNCASCKSMCGMHDTVIVADNAKNASVGDRVSVSIPTKKGLQAMLIAYGIPLLYLLTITVLMAVFIPEKLGASLLLSGIILWFIILCVLEKKGLFFRKFKAEITEILNKEEDTNESK